MDAFEISDIEVVDGSLFELAVTAVDLETEGSNSIIKFRYPTNALYLETIVFSSDFGFSEGDFIVTTSDDGNTQITVTTDSFLYTADTLFLLSMRFLEGGQNPATIQPILFTVDNIDIEIGTDLGIVKGPGRIRMIAETDLSPNYPNPFYTSTRIKFSIIEPTSVRFVIYDPKARVISDIPYEMNNAKPQNHFEYRLLADFATEIWDRDYILPTGQYTLELLPQRQSLPAGCYFLLMLTDNSTYGIRMVMLR